MTDLKGIKTVHSLTLGTSENANLTILRGLLFSQIAVFIQQTVEKGVSRLAGATGEGLDKRG